MVIECPTVELSSNCDSPIVGAVLTLRLHNVDDSGDPVDAVSVVARLRKPDGQTVLPHVTRAATGEYLFTVTADQPGQFWWRYEFDGDALEGSVLVGSSGVLA